MGGKILLFAWALCLLFLIFVVKRTYDDKCLIRHGTQATNASNMILIGLCKKRIALHWAAQCFVWEARRALCPEGACTDNHLWMIEDLPQISYWKSIRRVEIASAARKSLGKCRDKYRKRKPERKTREKGSICQKKGKFIRKGNKNWKNNLFLDEWKQSYEMNFICR